MSDPCTQVDIDEATADAFVHIDAMKILVARRGFCHCGHLKAESQDFHELERGQVRPQGNLTIVEDSNTTNFAKGGTASAGEKELAFDTRHERKTDHASRGTNTRSEHSHWRVRERSCFEAHEKAETNFARKKRVEAFSCKGLIRSLTSTRCRQHRLMLRPRSPHYWRGDGTEVRRPNLDRLAA